MLKKPLAKAGLLVVVLAAAMSLMPASKDEPAPQRLNWVTGYWYSPTEWGELPVAAIDYSALTHIVHEALLPSRQGGFEAKSLAYITSFASDLVRTAHRHRVKVLLGLAQGSRKGDFLNAAAPHVLPAFLDNVVRFVEKYDYDGVDLDWENGVDPDRFQALVQGLRRRLDALRPKRLLTGAFWEPRYVAPVYRDFDQINVMVYDCASVSDGFSWHNAAIHSGGDSRRRSADWRLGLFTAPPSSIPPSRLGLGIPFYGYIWKGVSAPGQTWTRPPTVHPASYKDIVTNRALWRNAYHRRDETAGVPYLSDDEVFVTYDDEVSVAAKVAYARKEGLGGIMVYDLSGDYLPGHHPSHPLLEAVEKAVEAPLPATPSPPSRPPRRRS